MIIIKRYKNRKLYNSNTGRYITLAEILKLLNNGVLVQVICHETNKDLTKVLINKALVEQEWSRIHSQGVSL